LRTERTHARMLWRWVVIGVMSLHQSSRARLRMIVFISPAMLKGWQTLRQWR